ncbi:MAG: BON domain-containing protein [Terriglobia bacterium]|jgi:osmotically-inducible protein OsmY|nr:BON domain-containing protein [Terriglobia bacterium]
MKTKFLPLGVAVLMIVGLSVACSSNNKNAGVDKDQVKNQLQQAGLNDVKVDVDNDKKVVTLQGDVQSDDQKNQAERIAQSAAPAYVVSNEIGVRPDNAENQAGKVDSNLDDGIKSNWKALEAKNNWGNQHINADVKNGVLTLKGDVDTMAQRTEIEKAAAKIPNVTQVVNELDVKSAKHNKKSNAQTASE